MCISHIDIGLFQISSLAEKKRVKFSTLNGCLPCYLFVPVENIYNLQRLFYTNCSTLFGFKFRWMKNIQKLFLNSAHLFHIRHKLIVTAIWSTLGLILVGWCL